MILNGSVAIYASRDPTDVTNETMLLKNMLERSGSAMATVVQDQVIPLALLCPGIAPLYPHVEGLRDRSRIEYTVEFLRKELKFFDRQASVSPSARLFDDKTGALCFTFIATLAEGAIFGEKGLDESTPRTATVVCTTDTDLGYLLKADYDGILKDINRADTERRKGFFNQVVFRNAITAVIALRLSYDFYKKKSQVKRGFCLREQGKRGKLIYVVRRGQVCVEKTETVSSAPPKGLAAMGSLVASRQHQKTFVVSYLGEGELMGEEVLFEKGDAEYTLRVSSTEATIMEVTVECLTTYLKIDKKVVSFLSTLHTLRKKQWANVLHKMRYGMTLVSDRAALPRIKHLPQVARPVADSTSFDLKYDNELSRFLIDKVEYRLPYLVRQNDRETCVELHPDAYDDMWVCREPTTEHYLHQDKSLRELDKQDWMLKNGHRLRIMQKFNKVLRDQVSNNPSLAGQLAARRRPLHCRSESSIIDTLNRRVTHNRSQLDLSRRVDDRPQSLVCTARLAASTGARQNRSRLKADHSLSANSVLQCTKYDNCTDWQDRILGTLEHDHQLSNLMHSDIDLQSSIESSGMNKILIDASVIDDSHQGSTLDIIANTRREKRQSNAVRYMNKIMPT